MRTILVAVCLLPLVTLPCQAQGDKAKPNTLTPKEIADGWILLFDGETTFGWRVKHSSTKQQPKVNDEALDLSGLGDSTIRFGVPFVAFEVQFEYFTSREGKIDLDRWVAKPNGIEAASLYLNIPNKWTSVSVRVENGKVEDDRGGKANTLKLNWSGMTEIGLGCNTGNNFKVRNIKLRPLNITALFNGKDLDGWHVFPGDKNKSKFTVKDGAINVKDGPGDLQTAGKYKDFILQLECISNGKHLNSGIFFRCRDNEYQNGYEAQIRNQFTDKATQKYLLEEYDPMTNKLTGKKEITSTAFDFGTGAIYRRVPARKEMSKDNEWFGMTIVAHGNHLATWVNGVQVVDWFDHRPKSDNARTGCKLEAGHISIQGHDPTTDLSFRNFRIGEFK